MRHTSPFRPEDLCDLGLFYGRAWAVAPMGDIYKGETNPMYIGMRHDCDNVIEPAVAMAEWEASQEWWSTYYILHTSPYWQDKTLLRQSLERIAGCGHEIGIHNDAITGSILTGRPPGEVLHEAIEELRGYGFDITSTVAHGHHLCGVHHYVNDEVFTECHRDVYGDISRLGITPVPLSDFGLLFDSNWLPRGDYISDSGGQWSQPFDELVAAFPSKGQLHMLVHPDWWAEAFVPAEVAA